MQYKGPLHKHPLKRAADGQGWRRLLAAAGLGALCAATCGGVSAAEVPMPVSFSQIQALEYRDADLRSEYGREPSQHAYLWLPESTAAAPVVVLVHGGCWLSDYSAPHVFPLASRLAADGYAVWVPEYRRVGEPGGGWPGSAADLLYSLDLLTRLQRSELDLSRTVFIGHSAGGHLALWLAGRDARQLPPALSVSGVLGLAPITDLAAYAAGGNSCQAVTETFMGGPAAERSGDYRQASPAKQPVLVPTLLLRGEDDGIVGAEQVDAMPSARRQQLAEAAHFDWIHPDTAAYGMLRRNIEALLETGQFTP